MVKNPPANAEDTGSIPGSGRSPGERKSNPLQYSCLGNPMDRGAWWATAHGVARVGHHLTTEQSQEVCPAQVHFTFKETSRSSLRVGSNLLSVDPRSFSLCMWLSVGRRMQSNFDVAFLC